jgi:hypothetical protein
MTDMSAQELANALGTVLRPQPQDPLSREQHQAALQYRLIRNGLGNFGGHGDAGGDIALIRMTQTVTDDRIRLTFQDALPLASSELAVYAGTPPKLVDTIKITRARADSYWVCEHTAELKPIVRVEVLDQGGAPIAAGVPSEVATAVLRMTQTVLNTRVSQLTFEDALPDHASQLTLHFRTPTKEIVEKIKKIDPKNRSYMLFDDTEEVERIERVDVLDQYEGPIATGVLSVDARRVPRQRARS